MKILLVEPDRILGQAVHNALEERGHSVGWKRGAQGALDALDETLPDAIVLELQLGIHNGVEFLYEIASYPEWQQIPIIIHTINPRVHDQVFSEALAQLNVQAVFYKPQTTTQQLIKSVAEFATAQ